MHVLFVDAQVINPIPAVLIIITTLSQSHLAARSGRVAARRERLANWRVVGFAELLNASATYGQPGKLGDNVTRMPEPEEDIVAGESVAHGCLLLYNTLEERSGTLRCMHR